MRLIELREPLYKEYTTAPLIRAIYVDIKGS